METPYKLEIRLYANVSSSDWKMAQKELSYMVSLICKDERSTKNYIGEYKHQQDLGRPLLVHRRHQSRLDAEPRRGSARALTYHCYGVIDEALLDIIFNHPDQQEWTDDIHPFYDKGYREVQASDIMAVMEKTRDNGLGWLHEFVLSKTVNCPEKFEVRFV